MHRTYVQSEGEAPRRNQIPKPCEHFDLIVGTGTGGLIALMLGRLRLDVETCKEVYVRMTRRVFETDKTIAGIPYRSTLFKASRLEEAIKECVREHTIIETEGNDSARGGRDVVSPTGSPKVHLHRTHSRGSVSTTTSFSQAPFGPQQSTLMNGLMWGNPDALLYDNREFRTKTAVTAVYKGTPRNGSFVLLRSYDSRKEPAPEFDCTIWQAGRATSATGLAFKPIQIGQHLFIDEGAGTYNPAPEVLDEAVVNEWPGREIGVFVSIGTGKRPAGTNHQQHEWWEGFFGDTLGSFAEARKRLIAKIEGCEEIHQAMLKEHLPKRKVSKDNYYRLNVEVGVGEFGMNEWHRLAEISTNTRRYLARGDVRRITLDTAIKLSKIQRMHRRLAAHAAAAAGNGPDIVESASETGMVSGPPSQPILSQFLPPPANAMAVELPAEDVPAAYQQRPPHKPSTRSHTSLASRDDKFIVVGPDEYPPSADGLPHQTVRPSPPRRSGEVAPHRASHEYSRPTPPQSNSPRISTDAFNVTTPPPRPPKTPIPYPDDGDSGEITMPVPPANTAPDEHLRPPYPVGESPPAVNKLRKPTYNVR
jgi:hypothetical protein